MHAAEIANCTCCHGYVTHSKAPSLSCLGLLSVMGVLHACCLQGLVMRELVCMAGHCAC